MELITTDTLKAMYAMLCKLPPFNKYTLPRPSEIVWEVINDPSIYGQYTPSPHCITISKARCGHLDTILRTVAHEIIHMILYLQGKKYELHNKNFTKLSYQVASIYGWDPKEL